MDQQKYKEKYLKYKSKYLNLKYQLENYQKGKGNGIFGTIGNMMRKGMPMGMPMGNSMANESPLEKVIMNIGMSLADITTKFGMQGLPFQQQESIKILHEFVNPQNIKIFSKIVASLFTHLLDPRFYPMLALIIKDITFLMGSATTANPIVVMISLNNALNNMRITFPKEFRLLKLFFMSNRHKIIPMLQRHNPMFGPMLVNDATYSTLVNFIFH